MKYNKILLIILAFVILLFTIVHYNPSRNYIQYLASKYFQIDISSEEEWRYFYDNQGKYSIRIPRNYGSTSPIGGCIHDSLYSGMEFTISTKYQQLCEKDGTEELQSYGIGIISYNEISNPDNLPFFRWYENFVELHNPANPYSYSRRIISSDILEYDFQDKKSGKYIRTSRVIDHGEGKRIEFIFNKYMDNNTFIVDTAILD